jgi:hypothetical protein
MIKKTPGPGKYQAKEQKITGGKMASSSIRFKK